jgi:hypothetical protein
MKNEYVDARATCVVSLSGACGEGPIRRRANPSAAPLSGGFGEWAGPIEGRVRQVHR